MQFPYIGTCDVASSEQVQRLFQVFARNRKYSSNRLFMPGLMMSYKTLRGIPSKWSAVFPPKETIKDIFSFRNPLIMNTLHYADYEGVDVVANLELATRFGGPNLDAIQLDMIWPYPGLLREYRKNHPAIKIVLQAGGNALEELDNDPNHLAWTLAAYGNAIDYVLLDKSMGKGLGLDAKFLLPFMREIKNSLPQLGIGFAGGLGPDTMNRAEPLLKEFPDASFDMQSGLRSTNNAMDPIDIERAESALVKALEICS